MDIYNQAKFVAKKVFDMHTQKYITCGEPFLSKIIKNETSEYMDYLFECIGFYDYFHKDDPNYPGIKEVYRCYFLAFEEYYVINEYDTLSTEEILKEALKILKI